ncbi:MAG: hypothetical protein K6E53_15285 [Lachnospiraceae bacterium]|nr:hypothetical protein [Lachnospiraceae bacterium]
MADVSTNTEKHDNYTFLMRRLSRAIKSGFLLEAVLIEGSIIEDRVESFLRTAGKFNPERHSTLDRKLSRLTELQRNKKDIVRKYVTEALLNSIYRWKEDRNAIIHALTKRNYTEEEIASIVEQGQNIVKALNSKSTSYRRMMEKGQKGANR